VRTKLPPNRKWGAVEISGTSALFAQGSLKMTTRSLKAIKVSAWSLGVALLSSTLLVASNAATNPFAGHLHVISTGKSGTASAAGASAAAPTNAISRMPIWWGGSAFILSPAVGMSDTPVTAQGYEYVLSGDLSNQWKTLRAVFNVTGNEQKSAYGWQVNGDVNNPGSLYLSIQGVGSWSYYLNNFAVSQGCFTPGLPTPMPVPAPATTSGSTPGSSGGGTTPGVGPGTDVWKCPQPVGDPSSIPKAIEVAKRVHAQIGGSANVEWSGQANGYNGSVDVTAVPLLNGTKVTTGSSTSWHYNIGSDGKIASASGSLALPVTLQSLPVLGARSAAERVNGKQWTAFGPFVTGGYPVGIMNSSGADAPSTHVAGQINIGINKIAVKNPAATLIEFWNADGTLMLLPGYQYSADKAQKFAVIAVSDSKVTFTQVDNGGIQPMMK
jgi:hypothetical protein